MFGYQKVGHNTYNTADALNYFLSHHPKDIALLGYKIIVDDDPKRLEELSASPIQRGLAYIINKYRHDQNDTENIGSLAKKLLKLISRKSRLTQFLHRILQAL